MSWDDYGYRGTTHDTSPVFDWKYEPHIHGQIGHYGPHLSRLDCLVYALLGRRALVHLLSRRRRLRP